MDETTARIWQDLIARITGPMSFRLVLQPAMAVFLAVKAGLDDGRHGRPAFLWAAFHDPAHRRDLLKEGWKSIAKVFCVAVVLDGVYQFLVLRWFYPGEALLVAIILALIPYILIRGLVTRLTRGSQRPARGALRP